MEKHVDNVDFEFMYGWTCDAILKVQKERYPSGPQPLYYHAMEDFLGVLQVIFIAYPEFLRLNAGEHKREEENENAKNQKTVEESK